jgi:polyphosphate kinase
VFQIFHGFEDQKFDKDLLVTRYNARKRLVKLIDREADKGFGGYISMKCNALDDSELIEHLDNAASKGCKIDLIVRGVCTWCPGDNKNATVRSVVWDKLEHSRVYCFGRENPAVYLGSLDPVTHKLDKRIETLVRIKDPDIIIQVCKYLNRYIANSKHSWIQGPTGYYMEEK